MKKIVLILFIFTFLIACEKSNNGYNLTSIDSWTIINFKSNYTIQVPDGFEGIGMAGFEGNTFFKNSPDNKIKLSYAYCNALFCNDFGDSLGNPIPNSISVKNNSGVLITLNKREYFYQNSDLSGILYYSNNDPSRGRLFWKDSDILKAALEIDFNLSEIDTVKEIIGTIKSK
jgi:hypothetical protein